MSHPLPHPLPRSASSSWNWRLLPRRQRILGVCLKLLFGVACSSPRFQVFLWVITMANSFGRGANSMDYKFGSQRDYQRDHHRDHQRDLLTEWGKKKPQKFLSTSRQPVGQRALFAENDSSHFKMGFVGENKQRFGVGFDSACTLDAFAGPNFYDSFNPQPSYAPSNSFFSDYPSSKSFLQPQNDSRYSMTTMEYFDSTSKYDSEGDKTANILAALNKILEDTEDHQYNDECNSESESIGQLAIKLADLNMIGNENDPSAMFHDKPEESQIFCKDPIHKTAKCDLPPSHNASSNILLKNERPAIPKRKNDFIIKEMKKKRYIPWNWYHIQNQNNVKDPRKIYMNGYGMKPSQKQSFRNAPPTPMAYQAAPGQKSKTPSSKFSGPPFWMQFMSNDSKSDGSSSSSNSSLYKDHASHTSADSLNNYKGGSKSNDSGKAPFPPSRQPRRFRRAYSTASSSSGGKTSECVFCKTNGETSAIFRGHVLKDDQGRTVCPVLQQYVCSLCGATGFNAHTIKYCPKNENPPPIATMTTLKSMRSSTGRKRHGPCSKFIRPIPFGFGRSLLPA
ncbi:uncharacterized protein LOC117641668 [Thrips palmi]|uniref:Uncharacterized protein LOC117641668 n=1 Tax=Thrips palmi TaxID=161013 RepID=A0A6P8YM26_THRPL|nr:uncharacterized protein LOC117641668 [Thrips palmi]